jgi:predicted permease
MVGLEPVSMLFLLIVLGYGVGKRKIVSENMIGDISALLVNVALPAFIITYLLERSCLDPYNKGPFRLQAYWQ